MWNVRVLDLLVACTGFETLGASGQFNDLGTHFREMLLKRCVQLLEHWPPFGFVRRDRHGTQLTDSIFRDGSHGWQDAMAHRLLPYGLSCSLIVPSKELALSGENCDPKL